MPTRASTPSRAPCRARAGTAGCSARTIPSTAASATSRFTSWAARFERMIDHPNYINHVTALRRRARHVRLPSRSARSSTRISTRSADPGECDRAARGRARPGEADGVRLSQRAVPVQPDQRAHRLHRHRAGRRGDDGHPRFAQSEHHPPGSSAARPARTSGSDGTARAARWTALPGAIEAHMQAGDAIVFVDAMSHGSARRMNAGERKIAVYRYGSSWNRTRWGYHASPELLARANPFARESSFIRRNTSARRARKRAGEPRGESKWRRVFDPPFLCRKDKVGTRGPRVRKRGVSLSGMRGRASRPSLPIASAQPVLWLPARAGTCRIGSKNSARRRYRCRGNHGG
jgi:hypothetical protein